MYDLILINQYNFKWPVILSICFTNPGPIAQTVTVPAGHYVLPASAI